MTASSFFHMEIGFTIWWEPGNPNVIKMGTGDPRFVNDDGPRRARGFQSGGTTRTTSPEPLPPQASRRRLWWPEGAGGVPSLAAPSDVTPRPVSRCPDPPGGKPLIRRPQPR